MSHKEIIKDMDSIFEIDPVTRQIRNTSPSKVSVVQYDHNSERFRFSLQRFIEGHDMATCNRAEVHYLTKSGASGVYEITDLAISEEDEDKVACSWLLSQNATNDTGTLAFLLRFSCVAEDGTIDYAWNTGIFSGISITAGMYNAKTIVEQYADVLEQWKKTLQGGGGNLSDEQIAYLEKIPTIEAGLQNVGQTAFHAYETAGEAKAKATEALGMAQNAGTTALTATVNATTALNKIEELEKKSESGEDKWKITLIDRNETPVLGEELATADGWTTSGWTGSFATGFTHTSGNTSPLSFNIPNIAVGKSYVIAFRCSVAFTPTNILVTIGEAPAGSIYGIANDNVTQWGVKAEDTGALTFTPESTFTGTISEISIREITGVSTPYMSVYDTEDNIPIEQRTGKESLQNIFIGKGVGGKNISGFDNYAIGGDDTLQNNISGFWNVAIGQQTLQDNVSGSRNISIGRSNLMSNISGARNVCIGTYVLTKAKNPNHNVCIGADAMNLATGSENNVAIGFQAMYNNTTGSHMVAIGNCAGMANTTGIRNVFIGSSTGSGNTTGNYNMAFGYSALQTNQTGNSNVAIGNGALYKGTSPKENVAIGQDALAGTSSTASGGQRNVAIGYGAIKNETAVHYTVAIGHNTAQSLTTGQYNIVIGSGCDLAAGSKYKLNIGNLLKGDMTEGSAYLDVNGGLQLGSIPTSDPNIAGRVWNDNGTLKVSTGA